MLRNLVAAAVAVIFVSGLSAAEYKGKLKSVDAEKNLVVLKGAIPGATGTLVTLKQA